MERLSTFYICMHKFLKTTTDFEHAYRVQTSLFFLFRLLFQFAGHAGYSWQFRNLFSRSTILQDCSHPGVAGLLIYLLKEQVNQALGVRCNVLLLANWTKDNLWSCIIKMTIYSQVTQYIIETNMKQVPFLRKLARAYTWFGVVLRLIRGKTACLGSQSKFKEIELWMCTFLIPKQTSNN